MSTPTLEGASVVDRIATWDETVTLVDTVTPAQSTVKVTSTLTWLQSAIEVLPQDGTDMGINEILAQITERGLRDLTNAKTPIETLRRDLNREAGKENARVRKVGKSNYSRT